ncbi:non-POU domain-containing octamer-binding protein-like isoform X2 [Halichondria panicea]|uniref:non-POU domain-containing octamer-binding protein-like isoform X2 n=1 Tax=Halichondria panicea TaxID=6063 RepID=UPI00312B3C02
MAHRGGGGYTRGNMAFRQRGRSSGSPYWKDKPRHQQDNIDTGPVNVALPSTPSSSREGANQTIKTEQSPVETRPKEIKKFSNKARVFIANLPREMSETELRELFRPYGEVQEIFIQKEKSFAFCRMAYKSEAESAIAALNGMVVKGRDLKVRFAVSSSLVKVENIHPLVSNELLSDAFAQFGEVEEAVVVTDDRGKSKGCGIVEFARKQSAMNAISQCRNAPFLLTRSPIPVVVSEYERDNEEEGQSIKNITKNQVFHNECDIGPRFANHGDVEFIIANRWKVVFDDEKAQRAELEARIKDNRAAVRDALSNVHEQHKTEMLRQELVHHQQQQMRLLQQLSEREGGGLMPPMPSGLPPPLFPGDRQEGVPDPGAITIPGLGGHGSNGGGLFPQPLMGQV